MIVVTFRHHVIKNPRLIAWRTNDMLTLGRCTCSDYWRTASDLVIPGLVSFLKDLMSWFIWIHDLRKSHCSNQQTSLFSGWLTNKCELLRFSYKVLSIQCWYSNKSFSFWGFQGLELLVLMDFGCGGSAWWASCPRTSWQEGSSPIGANVPSNRLDFLTHIVT